MNKFNLGDIAYFIANGYHIREATVIRNGSGFCTIGDYITKSLPYEFTQPAEANSGGQYYYVPLEGLL